MDKYTVDLDQVLNDFEYSELTTAEQHQPPPATTTSQHVPQKSYSSTKHSINNVFSSLNDYLSTEINENVEHGFQLTPSHTKLTTTQNAAHPRHSQVNHVAGGTPVKEVPLESLISQPISLKIENNDSQLSESDEIMLNDIETMKELQRSFSEMNQEHSELENMNIQENVEILQEISTFSEISQLSVMKEDTTEVNNAEYSKVEENNIKEDISLIQDEDLVMNGMEIQLTETNAKLSCDKIGFHVEVADEEAAKYLADLEDDEDESFYDMPSPSDILRDSVEVKNEVIQENVEVISTHLEVMSNIDVVPTNLEVISTNLEIIPNNVEVMSNLGVAPQNLEVMPNLEMKPTNVEVIQSDLEVIPKNVEVLSNNFEVISNLEVTPKSFEVIPKNSEVITNLGVIQQTVDNIPRSCEVMTSEAAPSIDKHEEPEITTITGEEISEMSTEVEVKSEKEDISMQVEVIVVDKAETPGQSAETQRPCSLDIKEAKEEVVNIIGNPGSTPYNNIYVSKEVPAAQPETEASEEPSQDESESTASSRSPTFSEASTESVHSLDSPANQPAPQPVDQEGNNNLSVSVANDENVGEDGSSRHVEEMQAGSIEDDVNMTAASQPISEEEEVYVDLDSINQETQPEANSETTQENVHDNDNVVHETEDTSWLGKRAPIWIPDADALGCQHCELRFTVLKRRHHCRACGLVLCAKCCGMRLRLDYLGVEARVCSRCYDALQRETDSGSGDSQHSTPARGGDDGGGAAGGGDHPNPNNPMEYCSVVPPYQQVQAGSSAPSVMVPVGVLKRKGSSKKHNKSVMFCDGIRPGSDLTSLDQEFSQEATATTTTRKASSSSLSGGGGKAASKLTKVNKNLPLIDPVTQSFIPENENCLPPTVTSYKSDITYTECGNTANVVEMLQNESLTFAVQRNLHIHVRLIRMDCCVNKTAWCFTTEGLIAVGQDEIVILLEYIDGEAQVPKDVFHHLNNIYNSAVKGTTVTELGLSIHPTTNFLDSRNHAGFIFVRPSFQCLQHVIVPREPYLVGVLVHRWETPWARIFPLRLVLRLGAEYRYYPVPLISTRHRDSVFVEIGHTIINLLADFRNFSYTLPNIRGLTIHMEEKSTTVSIPVNRYDQVMKSMSNSSEHILAFGGNFSAEADSHLVCIQDTQGSNENSYKTHAINIQNKPRKVTGASFIVFNGALKSSSGLTAKSSIVEDGLMIQIPPEHMIQVRESLRNMKNHVIQCGCVNAASDETVNIVWCSADVNFNVGVKSSVDGQSLSGVPSIRVHNGKDYTCNSGSRLVRWTEVFLLQNGEENARTQDPVDISKVAESISKATCQALVKYLDLLATNSFMKIGIRTTLHVDDVSYSAGSNGQKLPPIYMKSLDNELVPVLHRITSSGNVGDGTIILELIFRILNV